MVEVFRAIRRVLKKTGSVYVVLGDTYFGGKGKSANRWSEAHFNRRTLQRPEWILGEAKPQDVCPQDNGCFQPKQLLEIPSHVSDALKMDGWILRDKIVWHKSNSMPGSQRDRLTRSYEEIFHFVKNTGKSLLWRNEITSEWVSEKPKQRYFHVDIHELRDVRPPKEGCYETNEHGFKRLIWKPLWRGFDYYYELDNIREPHTTAHKLFTRKTKPFGKKGSPSHRNAPVEESYPGDILVPKSWGVDNQGEYHGQATKDYEGANAQNPSEVKRRIIEGFKQKPKGKNPGDVFRDKTADESYKVGGMRNAPEPNEPHAFHPLGKNPGDIVQASPETRTLGAIIGEKGAVKVPGGTGWVGHPPGGMARIVREGDPRWLPPKGKNPRDFWTINTKPFKGAQFAVFPPSIVLQPILSSCPPDGGVVLDPMCGSGTVPYVCELINRRRWDKFSMSVNSIARQKSWQLKWIGIDINEAYVNLAQERIRSLIPKSLSGILKEIQRRQIAEILDTYFA